MNNIQNYGSMSINTTYGIQSPNFKSGVSKVATMPKTGAFKKAGDTLAEKFNNLIETIGAPMIVKIEPAKSYKELYSKLKSNIRVYKFMNATDISSHIKLLLFPKKINKSAYNAKEVTEKGYEFVQNNKDKLDILTYEIVRSKNTDYLKGMLKAVE